MDKSPLVSIIIPTYNRDHLIIETLDSVVAQNYVHWECLVVDDGSTDNTEEVLKTFINKDKRFKYYKRKNSKPKGANTCRNMGLEHACGKYVVFFDSDDLMTPNHLEVKVQTMQNQTCDFMVAKTTYFNHPSRPTALEHLYQNNASGITAYKFISHKVNWLTCDVCIKTEIAKKLVFNEELQSGQEYNYFSRLTLLTTSTIFVNKILTLRRYHDGSIRSQLRDDRVKMYQSYLSTYWHTYLDTKVSASLQIRRFLIYRCYRLSAKSPIDERLYKRELYKVLLKEFGLKGCYYIMQLQLKKHV